MHRFRYDYFDDGRLQRARRYTASAEVGWDSYSYDFAGRLALWLPGTSTSWNYAYSDDGNLTSAVETAPTGQILNQQNYTYQGGSAAGPHAVTAFGGANYAYDKAGRMRERMRTGTQELRVFYTDQDLPYRTLHQAGGQPRQTDYRYDAFGNRVVKKDATETVITIGKLYEERIAASPATAVTHSFRVYAGESIVAQESYEEESGDTDRFFVHVDRLGSSSVLINADGTIRQRLAYDPWGRTTSAIPSLNPAPLDIGYTGHRQEDSLGLIDMGGRLYDPVLRRVLTPDPLSSAPTNAGIHPYAYAMNDPVNLVDPSGFATECEAGIASGISSVCSTTADSGGETSVSIVAQEKRDHQGSAPGSGSGQSGCTGECGKSGPTGPGPGPGPEPNPIADIISGTPGASDPGISGPSVNIGVSDGSRTFETSQSGVFGPLRNSGTAGLQTGLLIASIFVPGPLGAVAGLVGAAIAVPRLSTPPVVELGAPGPPAAELSSNPRPNERD